MSVYTDKDKIRYLDKRKQGLCPRCRKPLDRQGYYCSKCLQKLRDYNKETRRFLKTIGICPTCGKNKLFGDEKTCPECVAKACEYEVKTREKDIKAYNERHSRYYKKRTTRYRAEGMCGKCGKNKPAIGYKTCAICLDKIKKWRATKGVGQKTEERYERVANGYCWYCDKPAETGYKTCAEHHNAATSWAIKAHEARKAKEKAVVKDVRTMANGVESGCVSCMR